MSHDEAVPLSKAQFDYLMSKQNKNDKVTFFDGVGRRTMHPVDAAIAYNKLTRVQKLALHSKGKMKLGQERNEYTKALTRLQEVTPALTRERSVAGLAYEALRAGKITEHQARVLGCAGSGILKERKRKHSK